MKIDIERLLCSLIECNTKPGNKYNWLADDIITSLRDQGLIYKEGQIFSELKESEVRKVLVRFHKGTIDIDGIKGEEILAWLEKQGEQKPTDKVEPKFKVGDKIRRKTPSSFDKDMEVARIEKDYYICNHIGKFSSEVVSFSGQSNYELVEQKPALSEEDEEILEDIRFNFEYNKEKMTDALIAQYNRFFDKIKSLKPQPKQEWSEEDSLMIDETIFFIKEFQLSDRCKDEGDMQNSVTCENWLKNLKEVMPQQKQDWSDEDKKTIDDACSLINTLANGYGQEVTEPITFAGSQMIAHTKEKLRELIVSKARNCWTPSDEQIRVLTEIMNFCANSSNPHLNNYIYHVLLCLRTELKHLIK